MLHIAPISLLSKRKDMEYSVDFKNMVKAHQGKFIGYGNPNAPILIIVPKIDDDRLAIYNENNSERWLANIENHTDFDDVEDFFANGEQVGNELTFNPLYPFKGQRDVLQKSKDGMILCNDGTCSSWHGYQYLFGELQWDITDRIDFFKYAFYTIYNESLLKETFFQRFRYIQYAFSSKKHLLSHDPGKLFDMTDVTTLAEYYHLGIYHKKDFMSKIHIYRKDGVSDSKKMIATLPLERISGFDLDEILKDSMYDNTSRSTPLDAAKIRHYIDLLAAEKIPINMKSTVITKILKTIISNIDINKRLCADLWLYAFHNLKDDAFFYSLDSNYPILMHILPIVFALYPPKIVREVVTTIIKYRDWEDLINTIDRCFIYPKFYQNVYVSKDTYNELTNLFDKIKSDEFKSILKGKLLWLKYHYYQKYGIKLGYLHYLNE